MTESVQNRASCAPARRLDLEIDLEEFSHFGQPQHEGPHHWLAAVGSSSIVYVILIVLLITVGTATKRIVQEKSVEVKFVETVVKEPPPPAPEAPKPKVEAKPPPKVAPPAAAPVVPKDMKIVRLDAPPPPKELVAPTDMPSAVPSEADPSLDKGIAVYGEGPGDVAGLEGGMAGGEAGGTLGPVELPADAEAPKPSRRNRKPLYPQVALTEQRTGLVILKVVINADGTVGDVTVVRGEDPFTKAAVSTVKKWRYEPAMYHGNPIAVFRIIQIPFKLETATG